MRIPRILALLCLLPAIMPPAAAGNPQRLKSYYHIAEGNYLIGDLGGAERGIEQMLRLDAYYAPALALRARVRLEQGNAAEALAAAEAATRAEPAELAYPLLEARILGQLGQKAAALHKIDDVLQAAPPGSAEELAAKQLKGLINMAEGQWDAAAASFKSIDDSAPEASAGGRRLASEAYLEKAQSQLRQGERNAAIESIDQAIALYENETGSEALIIRDRLRLVRGRTLARIGETGQAIATLRQLVAQSPGNLEAMTTLASIYAATDQWDSVAGLIEPLAAQPQLRDVALYLEGRVALARQRVGTARKKFEEALDLQKGEATGLLPTLLFYQGYCFERLGRKEEALAKMEEALAQNYQPETAQEAVLLGRMLMAQGTPQRALPLLEGTLLTGAHTTASAEAWCLLGRAHQAAGNARLALSALNESLSLKPNQALARALRGSLLRQMGDLEGAVADYEVAAVLDPSNAAVLYALALTQLQLGQLIAAEQKLGLACAIAPEQAGQHLMHALIAHAAGLSKTAVAALTRYFEISPDTTNSSAHYLDALLQTELGGTFEDPVMRYFEQDADRREVLDWAGRAEKTESTRSQICATAYWLAQYEKARGQTQSMLELLQIALETGNRDNAEWQFARWQMAKTQK